MDSSSSLSGLLLPIGTILLVVLVQLSFWLPNTTPTKKLLQKGEHAPETKVRTTSTTATATMTVVKGSDSSVVYKRVVEGENKEYLHKTPPLPPPTTSMMVIRDEQYEQSETQLRDAITAPAVTTTTTPKLSKRVSTSKNHFLLPATFHCTLIEDENNDCNSNTKDSSLSSSSPGEGSSSSPSKLSHLSPPPRRNDDADNVGVKILGSQRVNSTAKRTTRISTATDRQIWKCACEFGFLPEGLLKTFGNAEAIMRLGVGQCYHKK